MDFKSLMSAQIAKAKPKPTPSPSKSPTPEAVANSKYLRRAELEAARQAAYLAEQEKIQAEREERAAKKRKLEAEEQDKAARREEKLRRLAEESKRRREEEEREEERKRRKRLGLPDLVDQKAIEDGSAADRVGEDIPDDELRSKLRDLHEPASLFDEDHSARLKRYYALTRQKALTKAAQKFMTNGPVPTTLEPLPEKDLLLPETMPDRASPECTFLYRQIASYFTLLLTEWGRALNERTEEVKQSSSGKQAYQAYLTVLRDLTPLFRQLESGTLDHSLLGSICKILRSTQSRRYVEANDEYLTLSIGKAAWPIGVTMVGIHERSAREKLHDGNAQAHIMSDEVTRKFLQSIKRCISFAQTRWPPEDLGQLMG
ncbi:mRNA splicing factor [Cladophialophora carrionii]|uniref:Pre-mRNA-splicing factor 18 n=1 Tax=Cladophialophora carrionii TaxID=86049 RepID=A0A1C1CMU9_9EURO|nr:mRNA splicing factor [Cladophialophora carrionii]